MLVDSNGNPTPKKEPDRYIKDLIWAFTKPSMDLDRPDLLLVLGSDENQAKSEVTKELLAAGRASKVDLLNHVPIMPAKQMIQQDPDLQRQIITKLRELDAQ